MLICLSPAWILAQQPNPNDFSFSIRVDKQSYAPGDTVQATMGMTAKATGAQGWSYGVRHDPAVMELQTVNTDSTDVPSVFNGGFNTTTIITENGVKVGYIQAIVLSFISQAEVPITDFFSFCATTYTVKADACTGKNGDFESEIKYVHKEIGVPNSPPVDINLTVNGQALGPDEGLRTDPVQAKITLRRHGGGRTGAQVRPGRHGCRRGHELEARYQSLDEQYADDRRRIRRPGLVLRSADRHG
jgi:hypothetical protein